jgi:hypothetical protein
MSVDDASKQVFDLADAGVRIEQVYRTGAVEGWRLLLQSDGGGLLVGKNQ